MSAITNIDWVQVIKFCYGVANYFLIFMLSFMIFDSIIKTIFFRIKTNKLKKECSILQQNYNQKLSEHCQARDEFVLELLALTAKAQVDIDKLRANQKHLTVVQKLELNLNQTRLNEIRGDILTKNYIK